MTLPLRPSPLRWLLLLAAALIPSTAPGQTWRSTLYPENWQQPTSAASFFNNKIIQDFSYAGYMRGEEPVPNITGPIYNVVTGYGADATGANDSTVAIQNAITAAGNAGGGVVYLQAGTYKISPQGSDSYCLRINKSGVVLRGAGASSTFLLNTSTNMRTATGGSKTIIDARGTVTTDAAVNITADLPGPTRRIPVATPASFTPGDFVRIEWSFTDAWIAENGQQAYWNATNGYPSNAEYIREVVAVNSTEGWIEVDVPTRYSMKTRDGALVHKLNGLNTGIGIESLAVGNVQHPGTGWGEEDYSVEGTAAYDVHASFLLKLTNLHDCWVSGVESFQPTGNTSTCHMLSNGIGINDSTRVTLKDCRMRRPQYGGGGGNGYMYRVQYSNDCLIQNSIADFSRHGFVISHGGTSGNVFHQCEDRETQRATGSSGSYTTAGSGSDNHMHFSHSNLWDQCHAHNSFWTAHHRTTSGTTPHGVTSAHAVYWNTTGSGTRYTDIVRSEQLRYGYIIGTSGTRSGATNPTGGNTAPADHLEGIGSGATLEPQSLYLDQLTRRLNLMVTYVGNGATGGTVPIDSGNPYQSGESVTVLGAGVLVKTGYALSGWNTAADGSGSTYAPGATFEITANTILYAQWTANSYTVTFDTNGGGTPIPATVSVTYDAAYGTLAATSRSGYSFMGWFTTPSGGSEVTMATTVETASNHTLLARWNALPDVAAGPDQTVVLNQFVPWTPAQITTAAWYDATDATTITASSSAVSQWKDKSGKGNHAAQATAAARPGTGTTAIGGLNAISFRVGDGTNKKFLTAPNHSSLNLDASGGVNVFSVMRYLGYTDQGSTLNVPFSKGTILSANASYGIRVGNNQALAFRSGLNAQPGAGSDSLGQAIVYSGTRNDSTLTAQLHINGSFGGSVTSETPITSDNTDPLHIGRDPSTGRYADVDFGEIIVAGGTLSAEERQKFEGYLAHKWTLAGNLPADHPYKTTAPGSFVAIATLTGSTTDAENDPLTHTWSVVSGNAAFVSFDNPTTPATTATFTQEGVYILRLTSSDGFGTSLDEVTITVGDVTPSDPFGIWAGESGVTFTGDANNDGVADGLAWLLGATTPASPANALLPVVSHDNGELGVSFTMLNQATRGMAEMKLQYGTDLETWTTVAIPEESGTHDGVEFVIVPNGDVNEVTATVPADSRLFIRLSGTPGN